MNGYYYLPKHENLFPPTSFPFELFSTRPGFYVNNFYEKLNINFIWMAKKIHLTKKSHLEKGNKDL